MSKNKEQVQVKLNSVRNRYNNNESFIADMDNWPRTIKKLIYSSMELMIRFKLVELIPDPLEDDDIVIGME